MENERLGEWGREHEDEEELEGIKGRHWKEEEMRVKSSFYRVNGG